MAKKNTALGASAVEQDAPRIPFIEVVDMTVRAELPEYVCSRGHRWTDTGGNTPLTFEIGGAGKLENVCPHCLLNQLSLWMEKINIGRARKVESNGVGQ